MVRRSGSAVPVTWDAGHPDAETLAAYVDRKLMNAARETVERHASECEDCRGILADTTTIVEKEGGPALHWGSSFRWPVVTGVAAGLAAAAVLVITYPRLSGGPGRTAELEALIAASVAEPTRAVEGRLSGFPYAPAAPVTRGSGQTDLSPDIRIAVARIESAATADRSARALWALGVGHLVSRDVDTAITALEEAARLDAGNAELQSDLSAAHLARGRQDDLERALAAADRALTLQAGLAEALFNRAVALEALRRPEAAAAWRAVAGREAGTPWAKEAESRVSAMR